MYEEIVFEMATLPSVRKTTNGCEVAVPVRREITGFRLPSQCIAAIDFGTTNCSLAYITTAYNPIEGPTRLYLNNTHYRVPTAILFKPDGTVDSFGFVARTKFSGLTEVDGGMSYAYFEQIKMNLQHDEVSHSKFITIADVFSASYISLCIFVIFKCITLLAIFLDACVRS